jgi:VWFA-related protein
MVMRQLMALLLTASLSAQDAPVFHAQTRLAVVSFHVIQKDLPVNTLTQDDIELLEDGIPKPITFFQGRATRQRLPVEMILLFDQSGSVTNMHLLDPMTFPKTLLEGLKNVQLSVYGFDKRLRRYLGPSNEAAKLTAALTQIVSRDGAAEHILLEFPAGRKPRGGTGGTFLYESVITAANDATDPRHPATRLMLVFSDGLGTTTSIPEDAAEVCRQLGMAVYPVVLGHSSNGIDYMDVRSYIRLADLTGGTNFAPPRITLEVIRAILVYVVMMVQTEYAAGFQPEPSEETPRAHKLEIRLKNKNVGKMTGGTRIIFH